MAKNNYNKMYKENNIPEEVLNEHFETEITPEDVIEKTVKDVVEEKPKNFKPFMGEVIGNLSLNVRKQPGGEIYKSIPDGAQVRVIEVVDDNWYKIESPVGYVMSKFIKKI